MYLGKGIVIGMKLTFGLFGCKTRSSCVHNKTAKKQGGFSSFVAGDITCKMLTWWFIGSVGGVCVNSFAVGMMYRYELISNIHAMYNTMHCNCRMIYGCKEKNFLYNL